MIKHRRLIFTVLTLLVANAAALWLFSIAYRGAVEASENLQNTLTLASRREAEVIRRTQAGILLDSLREEEGLIDRTGFSLEDPVSFIESLETLGRRAGVTVQVAELTKGDFPSLLLFFSGDFAAAYRFLGALEYLPVQIDLREVAVSQGEGGWAGRVKIVILDHD